MNLFQVQLVSSFLIGAGVITAISFIVERIDKKYAGLILASPTTVVMGLFFLGLAVGTEKVIRVIPAIFLPLGISILFSTMYVYTALYISRFHFHKTSEILLTYSISIIFWILLIAPIIFYKFNHLIFGLAGCLILISLTHLLIKKYPEKGEKPIIITYTFSEKISRGIFIGLIMTAIVYLGKPLGPFWGGIFSVFPAVFSSTLPIFHWYNNPKKMYHFIKSIPTGAVTVVLYVFSCLFTFPYFGFAWGTLVSYALSLLFIAMITKILLRQT